MKVIPTFTITEFAEMKKTSRTTIYNNLDKFTINERGKVVWDKKAENWQIVRGKINKRYKKREKDD